ncbi:cytochrome P450 [Exidia glandulosa HHB12029]|uniref:Cytochrome P450 n=1 Tax=Exidia glandulosa HHB12029 TaxID=1314781 RepID=A0A165KVX4_EXIGL|nr:cytochrome P450 [Exidia glandulosa HHB12029]
MSQNLVLSTTAALSGAGALWLFWRAFRRYIVRSTLADIDGPAPDSWFTGNLAEFFSPLAYDWHHNLIARWGSTVKTYGFFGDEQIYTIDPRAMDFIMKNNELFEEQEYFLQGNMLWFGEGLLSTRGKVHTRQRRTIFPVFGVQSLRNLTPLAYGITKEVREIMLKDVKEKGPHEIDMHDWMSRGSLDYISKLGLGYSFDALDDSKPNAYRDIVKNFIPVLVRTAVIRQLIPKFVKLGPAWFQDPRISYLMLFPVYSGVLWFRRFIVNITPFEHVKLLKKFSDVLINTSDEVLVSKEKEIARGDEDVKDQIAHGKDIMSILLRQNMNKKDGEKLDRDELLGQISTLIFTAQDTTAAGLSRALQVLAYHPDVQNELRAEVTASRINGDLDYNALMGLPLLDAVCRETLRMYPPVAFTLRTSMTEVVLPLSRPVTGKSGEVHTQLRIPKDVDVCVGIVLANKDKALWGPDADEWRPKRWLEPMPEGIQELSGIYNNMMTFGVGPRSCIGLKFAEMEMKIVLSVLLETFVFDKPSREICWQLGNIQVPYLAGTEESLKPNLPLRVSLVEN